jgi:peptide chain release factor 3
VRWIKFKDKKTEDAFVRHYSSNILQDGKDRLCYGVKSDWDLKLCMEKNEGVQFFKNSDYIENHH